MGRRLSEIPTMVDRSAVGGSPTGDESLELVVGGEVFSSKISQKFPIF